MAATMARVRVKPSAYRRTKHRFKRGINWSRYFFATLKLRRRLNGLIKEYALAGGKMSGQLAADSKAGLQDLSVQTQKANAAIEIGKQLDACVSKINEQRRRFGLPDYKLPFRK